MPRYVLRLDGKTYSSQSAVDLAMQVRHVVRRTSQAHLEVVAFQKSAWDTLDELAELELAQSSNA